MGARPFPFPADGRAISRCSLCARERRGGDRRPGRHHPAHRRRNRRGRLQANRHAADQVDGLGRPHARRGRRAADRHARHARDIGAFERLSHVPRCFTSCRFCSARSMSRAGFATRRRYPKSAPPANKPVGKPDQIKPNTALPGMQLGFPGGPEDLLIHRRRHADPHRQGLFLGCPARRARPDAHGDRQRRPGRSRTPSTCCSCTWPTWRGIRR